MTMNDLTSTKGLATCAALILCTGVGGFYWFHHRAEAASTLPKELRYEALKSQAADDPSKLRETMRESMGREDLTDEQRRELGQNMRKMFSEMVDQRVDEYYKASEEEKLAVLDRHIAEFQERMKEWEQRRKEWEKEREKQEKENKDANAQDRRGPGRWGPQTQEERKAASESQNPDQTARRMTYFAAMQARAAERGIPMPMMGGRGMGPGGGGPGRSGP